MARLSWEMMMRIILLAGVVGWGVLGWGIGVEAWQAVINSTENGQDQANTVAVDARGDVIAAGSLNITRGSSEFTVVKLDGGTGAERWRQVLSSGHACAVTVDGAGDVLAAGWLAEGFAILKFDGGTGAERWRQVLGSGGSCAVTVDGAGDVLAAGNINSPSSGPEFIVLKLRGSTGVEQWRQVINGTANADDWATAVVDGAGDVVAAGTMRNLDTLDDLLVLKLDGGTGAERWRQVIDGTSTVEDGVAIADGGAAVTVDGAGDVVAAGWLSNAEQFSDLFVLKLDGGSGAERWRQAFYGSGPGPDRATAVRTDVAGAVVVAGYVINASSGGDVGEDVAVVKLDGGSGAERWHRYINGTGNYSDRAYAVVVDAAQDVTAAGMVFNAGTSWDFTVVKLRGTDGGDFGSCRGTRPARLMGRVRTSTGVAGVSGVVLTLSGPQGCRDTTTTLKGGVYGFAQVGEGTYTVTPTKAGCTFTPPQREVTLSGPLAVARFEAACQ
jgi:hypothetical protein